MGRALGGLYRGLGMVEIGAAALLVVLAAGAIVLDVLARALFNVAFSWANEFTRYGIVWMTFLGAAIGARRGAHISIDVLAEVLPPRAASIALRGAAWIAAVACGVLTWQSVALVMSMARMGQTSPSMELPMWMVYCALPLGFGLMTLHFSVFALTADRAAARAAMAAATG